MFFLAEICERGVEFMNKVVLLYMIALGIFAIPLYLFRNDIFSGMKEKRAYVRKEMKEKNLKKDKEKKIRNFEGSQPSNRDFLHLTKYTECSFSVVISDFFDRIHFGCYSCSFGLKFT